jgi:tetratricopeptide (TPR) repeat protein
MIKQLEQQLLAALLVSGALIATPVAVFAQIPSESAAVPVSTTPRNFDPQFKPTPEQVADSLMAHQRYQAAIESYKLAPHKSSESWNKMGVAYQLMFNLEEAVKCYQTALKLDPKNAIVMNNLGTIYVSLKQYSTAEKTYRKALKADPKSALVHKNLGTALLAEHKYKKGWQEYQDALSIDPNIFEHTNTVRVENPASVQDRGAMNYYMAKGCVRAGQNERAIEYLRMALNEGFTNPKKIAADSEFAALRDVPAFQQMLAAQQRTQ